MKVEEQVDGIWIQAKPDMKQNWSYTKWFRSNIGKRLKLDFVREQWDREIADMEQMEELKAEKSDPVHPKLTSDDKAVLKGVRESGVFRLMNYLDTVATQSDAEIFCEKAEIKPENHIALMKKVFKFLPYGAQMRQLVDKADPVYPYLDLLKPHRLGFSLKLFELGRAKAEREELVEMTEIPTDVMLDFLRRADLTRLHLMSGGMIRLSWAIGYKGLAALQQTTPEEYHQRVLEYYTRTAKGNPGDLNFNGSVSHIQRMQEAPLWLEE